MNWNDEIKALILKKLEQVLDGKEQWTPHYNTVSGYWDAIYELNHNGVIIVVYAYLKYDERPGADRWDVFIKDADPDKCPTGLFDNRIGIRLYKHVNDPIFTLLYRSLSIPGKHTSVWHKPSAIHLDAIRKMRKDIIEQKGTRTATDANAFDAGMAIAYSNCIDYLDTEIIGSNPELVPEDMAIEVY